MAPVYSASASIYARGSCALNDPRGGKVGAEVQTTASTLTARRSNSWLNRDESKADHAVLAAQFAGPGRWLTPYGVGHIV